MVAFGDISHRPFHVDQDRACIVHDLLFSFRPSVNWVAIVTLTAPALDRVFSMDSENTACWRIVAFGRGAHRLKWILISSSSNTSCDPQGFFPFLWSRINGDLVVGRWARVLHPGGLIIREKLRELLFYSGEAHAGNGFLSWNTSCIEMPPRAIGWICQ